MYLDPPVRHQNAPSSSRDTSLPSQDDPPASRDTPPTLQELCLGCIADHYQFYSLRLQGVLPQKLIRKVEETRYQKFEHFGNSKLADISPGGFRLRNDVYLSGYMKGKNRKGSIKSRVFQRMMRSCSGIKGDMSKKLKNLLLH